MVSLTSLLTAVNLELCDNSATIYAPGFPYPIASAHPALPESTWVADDWVMKNYRKRNSCCQQEDEMVLVLRVGGKDYALLKGNWRRARTPVGGRIPGDRSQGRGGVRGKRGSRGLVGELEASLWILGKNNWQSVWRSFGNVRMPGEYSVRREGVWFSLETGKLRIKKQDGVGMVTGYLVAMATAWMLVVMQPRFKPLEGPLETMYPAWSIQQPQYGMLSAAGGEVLEGDRSGYGELIRNVPRVNSDRRYRYLGKVSKIGRPGGSFPGVCGGCGGCVGNNMRHPGDPLSRFNLSWFAGCGGGGCGGGC